MPAVVEADDDGMYVLKFRGAGQGAKALVAEQVAGEIARALGLPVPEIVHATLDAELARTEPDPEIQDLIRASAGLNVALDYLPGALTYDPVADAAVLPPGFADRVVWFDAFVSNLDRTVRNTNLMTWHGKPWLIDHGAALYFHHAWSGASADPANPFALIRQHVLLPQVENIEAVDDELAARLTPAMIQAILAQVPDSWLEDTAGDDSAARRRMAYLDYLLARLQHRGAFVAEAVRARG